MMLMGLVSPWANITYWGCRYLPEARAETLRMYSVLHKYFRELNQLSIFDRNLDPEDEEYVLMSLTREERTPDPRAAYEPMAIRGWGRCLDVLFQHPSLGWSRQRSPGSRGPETMTEGFAQQSWSGS